MTRALFINSGILGQRTFAEFVRRAFAAERDGVSVVQVLVTDDLTAGERLMRRLLCARLSPHPPSRFANIDLHRFRCELNAGLLARNRIARLARAGARFDVLHFHRQATAYASLGLMRRIPAIVSCDTTQDLVVRNAGSRLEARSYGLNLRRDGEIFQAARLIISTSEWAARGIRDAYPACTTPIAVMPNPVPLPPSSDTWIEERFRRTAAPGYLPRVLFIGGDFPRKGGYDLLRAWGNAGLSARASLDVVSNWQSGSPTLPPGVTVHRRVRPYTPEWHALWRASDVFVLPTRDEAFGIVFQEAAAAGVPAIGTHLTAIPETVLDGTTGLLVPPGDERALVAALDTLLASPALRRDMGTRARAFIASVADPERYARALAAALRSVAGHCSPAGETR